MVRRPPRTPLFPTRRSSDLAERIRRSLARRTILTPEGERLVVTASFGVGRQDRSEEHTSELQSRFDLVCRLLLEKKKNTNFSPCLTTYVIMVNSFACRCLVI